MVPRLGGSAGWSIAPDTKWLWVCPQSGHIAKLRVRSLGLFPNEGLMGE